ncbi:Endopolygalacturonase [Xylariomycetidae sp. FL0641]|nr:Endopolygalacturonase [Xylariomycetidae sp. FL0641]
MVHFTASLLLALAAAAAASPVAGPMVTPAPALHKRSHKSSGACTFSGSDGAAKASASAKDCATIVMSSVAVPSGETLDLSDVSDGSTIIFEGETTWGYKEWDGPLLQIKGKSLTIQGAEGAVLNGDGARWWDGEGSNGGVDKPKFFYAHDLTDSTISNLYIKNTPVQAVSINGVDGLTVTDMTIDNKDGDKDGGHNTDAFDIGSSNNVNITGATVYNQDDCVAINSGTNIEFSNGLCSGGHGLSIGSVGGRDDNTVQGVTFKSSQVKDSDQGIRIKAKKGDTGLIDQVTYSDITMSGINKYGILIEQNYDGGDLHGDPTSGIPITNLVVDNVTGTVDSDGHNIAIVCGSDGCSDWTWDADISGGETYDECQNVPSVASC